MNKIKSYTLAQAQKKLEYYCAYQERCHKEVIAKLKTLGMIPSVIDKIISELIKANYLNETRFTQSFVRGKFRIKKWGKNRILQELKVRDISSFNIKLGMKEISDDNYQKTFYDLFEKRRGEVKQLTKTEQKKKIFSYMSYRGWENSKIYEALRDL
ncbi:MAG: regulatory protein RecX [Flavobacteriaceae bacterium]|nr:regulatory protein RecX [Flavobacteriaceae bacterium]MDG2235538.1 regulatory protein RecX [Flavobacteriaceae bacterium]